MNTDYPRDLIGYGATPPQANWPNKARLALQFVINYEEGGENCVLHGDANSETFLSEIIGAKPYPARHMSMESLYEYGSRAGFWRLHRLFEQYQMPVTIFGVAMALARNPEAVAAMKAANWEIASHAYRWIDHQFMSAEEERRQIRQAIDIHTEVIGEPPLGWYTGRDSPNTRALVRAEGGFLYDADSYADDLPYWVAPTETQPAHLVVPYTLDCNDMRFASPQGFNCGDQFYTYLKDSFDALYAEGEQAPKMMSVGLHCRIVGKPGRIMALQKFLDYVQQFNDVWVCRRVDIARHWHQHHPYQHHTKQS
ncbi:allantoinase PuuE [Simiduia aestuariiviva]|uniref:Putative urate catabolism protein n=1 Tax=Simiduia aestuariiviva TaxID=1510459 RepID=A0A839USP0_9GAMM|nr:allantoinase PuuE [Simiduia aestuariiviva]MBB3169480.1 putative urate catabolism protein [Simiduia aestuariiviva]